MNKWMKSGAVLIALLFCATAALAEVDLYNSSGARQGKVNKLKAGTNLSFSTSGSIGTVNSSATPTITGGTIAGAAITGSTINSSVIGGSSPAAITGTSITGTSLSAGAGDVTYRTSLLANGRYSPAGTSTSITLASSSTGLGGTSVPYTYIIKNIGGAGVDLTPGSILPNGLPGQELIILISGVGSGTCQWLLTPTTKTGYTSITFTATKQNATLIYDATLGWLIKSTNATINL